MNCINLTKRGHTCKRKATYKVARRYNGMVTYHCKPHADEWYPPFWQIVDQVVVTRL